MEFTIGNVLWVIAIGTIALLAMLWFRRHKKKRIAEMRAIAKALGMEFFEHGHRKLQKQLNLFFKNSGQMKNVILGETECISIAIFDCHVETSSEHGQATHSTTTVMIELRENEAAIRDFFDTEILDFFATRPKLDYERAGTRLIYFCVGVLGRKEIPVAGLRTFIREGYSLYEAFVERVSPQAVANCEETEPVERHEPPSVPAGFLVLLESLCCVMASDGKVARREKAVIAKVLSEVGSPLDSDEIEAYISDFVSRVKKVGFRQILDEAVEGLSASAGQIKNKKMFVQALNIVAKSDGEIEQRESRVIDQCRAALKANSTSGQT